MMVPATVIELNEPHVSFDHSSGQEAVARKRAGLFNFRSIQLKNVPRLAARVGQLGDRDLHAKCHLLLCDRGLNFWITDLGRMFMVELRDQV